MGNVFISHTKTDELAAREVSDSLRRVGHEIFFAPDPEDGINPGERWMETLFRELRICDAVVFLNSDKGLKSQWCHTELAVANDLGKWLCALNLAPGIRAHPVIADRQHIPFETSLADSIQRFIVS